MTETEKRYFDLLTARRSKLADALEDPCLRGIKTSVVDKYSDQAHFIYELIQNADDARATEVSFDVCPDKLVFTHNGLRRFTVTNPMSEAEDFKNHCIGDINAITGIGFSSKQDANKKGNAIGKFGMGFKSIFQYTNTPEIYDPNVAFRIERQIVPRLLPHDYPGRNPDETIFVFPFDNAEAKRPAQDSLEKLRSLLFPTLFLNNLQVITFNCGDCIGEYRKRITESLRFETDGVETQCERIEHVKTIRDVVEKKRMLLFSRKDTEGHRYSIGFMLGEDWRPVPCDLKAFCFFPTKHDTKLKFLIHAPFLLTDSRETIKVSEEHNQDMIGKLAELMYDCFIYMRDMRTTEGLRLIDDDILDIVPIGGKLDEYDYGLDDYDDYDDWEDWEFFKAFWTKAVVCFQQERMLPTADDYTEYESSYWPVTKQLPSIFPDDKLQALYGPDVHWVFRSKWNDSALDSDVSDFIDGCTKHSPSEVQVLDRITAEFIESQPIDWLSKFYKWIGMSEDRRKKAAKLPIFLDKNDKAVAAFDSKDEHILFLPALGADAYTTVSEKILQDESAKELIDWYKITTPSKRDLIRFIIEEKIPTAEGAEADRCLLQVLEYYASSPQNEKADIVTRLKGKVKLKSVDLETGAPAYELASELYLKTDFIRDYFTGIAGVNVVDDDHYHRLVGSRLEADFDDLLPQLGVDRMPVIMSRKFSDYRSYKWRFSSPAEKYWGDQVFTEQYIHGASAFLKRIDSEENHAVKKRLSLMLWDLLRFHADRYRSQSGAEHKILGHYFYRYVGNANAKANFLSGLHEYSKRGLNYEGFDSRQLEELRSIKWIVLDEGRSNAPSEIPINRLPSEYTHTAGEDFLVQMLEFKPAEVSVADREAAAAEAVARREARAREDLSAGQKKNLEMGELVSILDLTPEDLYEAKRRKDAKKLAEEQAFSATQHSGSDSSCDIDGETERIIDGEAHVRAHTHARSTGGSVMDNIVKNLKEFKAAQRADIPAPPLPELDISGNDDDEMMPMAIDFGARIRNCELRQAREIADLERCDALQQKATESEIYTFGWFKSLLDLELLGTEKSGAEQREISLAFAKMEKETGTDRTYVLKRPSRNIPQWIEDLSGIPLDLCVNGKTIRPVIEVMSVQSFNLRVKLKADAKIEGVDLTQLSEARITATRPAFLLEELKKGFCDLKFEDSKNLRDDLTEKIEFIFGPPGTGKTTYLAKERILPLMRSERDFRVLVLAPTNKAADVLTARILSVSGNADQCKKWLVRFGSTMDEKLEAAGVCPGKDVNLALLPRHVVVTTIARFPYDFCVTGNSAPQRLVDQQWDYIIIDEASMVSLASIVYPLYRKRNAQFIIAGDPSQIEPIISCDIWKDANIYKMVGLNSFVNPKTIPHEYQVVKLTTQYRSLPAIGRIFSRYQYGGILAHHRAEDDRRELELEGMPEIRPLTLLKFPVSPYESVYRLKRLGHGQNGGSSYQVYSALFAFEFVLAIAKRMPSDTALFRIGVISPYRAQADIVQKLVESARLPPNVHISAGTVHGFQGDECEMIVALFNPPPGISNRKGSFINKKNIINVAISRARDYLVLMMPDDRTQNLANMVEVRKIERLMREDAENCIVHETSVVEEAVLGSATFIEDNAFSTGHQSVNVYGVPEMRYEVRAEETAVDVQIQHDVIGRTTAQEMSSRSRTS